MIRGVERILQKFLLFFLYLVARMRSDMLLLYLLLKTADSCVEGRRRADCEFP